ncbi:interleukin-13 [Tachyglossus aculeatus]|uniref:interleukin-13 n=1 Tax=Tachyglossus aculeatus TaxID=9261 RepID=UPI0018F2A5F0|nr:interleukin-13 [Tachyglossus aculeatus]
MVPSANLTVVLLAVFWINCISAKPVTRNKENARLEELISYLSGLNLPNKQSLCNDSMVWKVNFDWEKAQKEAESQKSCEIFKALQNISDCETVQDILRIMQRPSDAHVRCEVKQETQVELQVFLKKMLPFYQKIFRETKKGHSTKASSP